MWTTYSDLCTPKAAILSQGQLERVIAKKAEAQRERDNFQADLEANCDSGRPVHPGDETGGIEGRSDAEMRQQMECMNERILALEAQQQELETRPTEDPSPPWLFYRADCLTWS